MKQKSFALLPIFAMLLLLGLTGCSRTVDDVANWKTKGNIEKLIKALADPKVEVRVAATEALGELKAEAAVNNLASMFNDSEEEVIVAAVNALAATGSLSTTTPLIAALKLDYPMARTTAAISLGEHKATGAVLQLSEALNDSEAGVQLVAAVSLGQIGAEKGSPALVDKLSNSSTELRMACATALGLTGGDVAIEGLIEALADDNAGIAKIAVASLVQLGKPVTPFALVALKNDNSKIRKGSIAVLRGIKAVPLTGTNMIWYKLAQISVDQKGQIDLKVVQTFVKMGDDSIDTLLEAVAHSVPEFREHASLALEKMGNTSTAKAAEAAKTGSNSNARTWLKNHSKWKGAPAWQLDLWSSLAALNPDFNIDKAISNSMEMQARAAFNIIISPTFKPSRAYIPLLIDLLGDETIPPPPQPDYDADGIPIIKKAVDRFRGEANQQVAKEKLADAGYLATLPLIAAIEDPNELIAGHAAEILGEQREKRALKSLMKVVGRKIKEGEQLTTSPFYTALQKMEAPEAEPLLLKIRPSPDRAMHVFEHKYSGIRPISAETKDETGHLSQPVKFRLGYLDKGRVGELMITFAKNGDGDWKPSPALAEQLPSF